MYVPGTYISVRSEGLISAGRVATGIVAVVGTAASGPVGAPVVLSGMAHARVLFGAPDDYFSPRDATPLTLVRAIELVYMNGASTVVAVRVAGTSQSRAGYTVTVQNAGDAVAVVKLTARTPGDWGNDIFVEISAADDPCRIEGEVKTSGFAELNHHEVVPSASNRIRVRRGVTRRTETFDIVYKRVIRNEEVLPREGRFLLAHAPVVAVAPVNQVEVLDSQGETVRV